MEQKIDLNSINSQALDPKQEKELFAALSDEELANVAGGSYVKDGHVCGSLGHYGCMDKVEFDFEVGTRVQVTRHRHSWASWSATIIDRRGQRFIYDGGACYYAAMYKVHFDGYDSSYDDWYEQYRLYI